MYLFRCYLVAIVAFFCFNPALALNVCEFDELLMNHFVEMYPKNDSVAHALLDGVARADGLIDSGECEGIRLKNLQKGAASFLTYDGHVVKSLNFEAMNLEDEEVALLNLLLEYVEAKYNSAYSYAKNHQPKPSDDTEALIQLLSELASISKTVLWTEFKNPTPVGVVSSLAAKALPSWLYLWIRQDNPFTHDFYYDFDYSWLLVKRDIYLKSFPDDKYSATVKALITDDAVVKMHQRDKNRLNFHFGMNAMIGKSLFNSVMNSVDESFSCMVQARFQFYSALIMVHINALFGEERGWGGFGLMGGYTLMDLESYGIDIFGGVSLAEETIKYMNDELGEKEEHKNSFVYFSAGVQFFKRFPIGDMFDITPKIQWQIEVAPVYTDFSKNRDGVGVMNRFYIGIGFDGKAPMGNPREGR